MSALALLRIRLQINNRGEDKLLKLLLTEARSDILAYTNRGPDQWLPIFDPILLKIAAEKYGKLGAEGIRNRAEGDVSTTFSEDAALKELSGYRLIKGF